MPVNIQAQIDGLKYVPGKIMTNVKLKEFEFDDFDINSRQSTGLIKLDPKNKIAFSKWSSPKRTRTYPFARIYDTYCFGGKRVTVIPIIKDEGLGEERNDSNNDRINFITLSWMNLTNVYIVLAWYEDAKRKSSHRITKQIFDNNYVKDKIKEISEYQSDAHHWNNSHFKKDYIKIYKKAVLAYQKIGEKLNVQMHPSTIHLRALERYVTEGEMSLDLDRFSTQTLRRSELAAIRETGVLHQREFLSRESKKAVFLMRNNLGGVYHLTSDEVVIEEEVKHVTIVESKNSGRGKLPAIPDIKDGLFKCLLFSQLKEAKIEPTVYKCSVALVLTGIISKQYDLPLAESILEKNLKDEKFSNKDFETIKLVNEEAINNNFKVSLKPNSYDD